MKANCTPNLLNTTLQIAKFGIGVCKQAQNFSTSPIRAKASGLVTCYAQRVKETGT
jgi:hypothetical protein